MNDLQQIKNTWADLQMLANAAYRAGRGDIGDTLMAAADALWALQDEIEFTDCDEIAALVDAAFVGKWFQA